MNLVKLIKKTPLLIYVCLFLLSSKQTIAQKKDSTISEISRHQIGIGLSNFLILSKKTSSYDLLYFYNITSKSRLRSHLKYDETTGNDGKLDYGIKLGFDKQIKAYTKWLFYYGIDIETQLTYFNIDDRNKRKYSINPLIGIQFFISKHFSLSTEPTFSLSHIIDSDPTNFSSKTNTWNEYKLDNIGLINVNFQF